jgi:hypothetical protein
MVKRPFLRGTLVALETRMGSKLRGFKNHTTIWMQPAVCIFGIQILQCYGYTQIVTQHSRSLHNTIINYHMVKLLPHRPLNLVIPKTLPRRPLCLVLGPRPPTMSWPLGDHHLEGVRPDSKAEGTPKNLAIAPHCNFREPLLVWVEHMLLNGGAQIEEMALLYSVTSNPGPLGL